MTATSTDSRPISTRREILAPQGPATGHRCRAGRRPALADGRARSRARPSAGGRRAWCSSSSSAVRPLRVASGYIPEHRLIDPAMLPGIPAGAQNCPVVGAGADFCHRVHRSSLQFGATRTGAPLVLLGVLPRAVLGDRHCYGGLCAAGSLSHQMGGPLGPTRTSARTCQARDHGAQQRFRRVHVRHSRFRFLGGHHVAAQRIGFSRRSTLHPRSNLGPDLLGGSRTDSGACLR